MPELVDEDQNPEDKGKRKECDQEPFFRTVEAGR
jgi:hypothetical protein